MSPVVKTIRMVEVAAFAANRAGVVVATITVTDWRTRSAASPGNRSYLPRAQRTTLTALPSQQGFATGEMGFRDQVAQQQS
jgi:hypothetical protein